MTLNRPNPRLQILRAQLAAEADAVRMQRASYKISNAVGCSCPVPAPDADSLPLPPDYWSDLEHWLKTLAPAKPAAEQPEPSADVWHSEAPSVAGVYIASRRKLTDTRRYWNGSQWSMPWYGESTEHVYRSRPTDVPGIRWLRLIEADKPAQQPAQKASTEFDYLVCIGVIPGKSIGDVVKQVGGGFDADYWRRCDESGWVTHVPTADAVCPVPDGVGCQLRLRDRLVLADVSDEPTFRSREYWQEAGGDTIIAWRPIAQS